MGQLQDLLQEVQARSRVGEDSLVMTLTSATPRTWPPGSLRRVLVLVRGCCCKDCQTAGIRESVEQEEIKEAEECME